MSFGKMDVYTNNVGRKVKGNRKNQVLELFYYCFRFLFIFVVYKPFKFSICHE